MKKSVLDLTTEELSALAREAAAKAIADTHRAGLPTAGMKADGRLVLTHPDGRVEDLKPSGADPKPESTGRKGRAVA
jgi:hypothetical protein